MKKLMMIAAVVIAAVSANAAAVTWNTGALYLPNADGTWSETKASGTTAGTWLATVTIYADNSGTMGAALTGITGNTDDSVNTYTGALNGSASSVENSKTYWAVLELAYTTSAGTQTLTTDAYQFTTKSTGATPLNFQTVGALSSSDTFTAVPEPTSGVLLLLGMAGLALRRRRA